MESGVCVDAASPTVEDKNAVVETALQTAEHTNTTSQLGMSEANNETEINRSAKVADAAESNNETENLLDGFDEEDADDDEINVIIKPTSKSNVYKTGTTYQARSQISTTQSGKVVKPGLNINDPGNIHGVPTIEYNVSTLGDDDKPWKRPGADITDYFNYGFTEDTWLQYCEKQKMIRLEYANTALKPVLVGPTAGFGLGGLSSSNHRGMLKFPQQNQQMQNKDITILGGRARSQSGSGEDEISEKKNGILGSNQPFGIPPHCFPPPSSTAADALAQFGGALNYPPPGFTGTNVPPPLIGTGFPGAPAGCPPWPQAGLGNGLIQLFPGQNIRPASGRGHRNDRRDRTPENVFEEEYSDSRRSRYRDDDQESRYDRVHRTSRRSRSRSRDFDHGGRSRRKYYEESSSRDHRRHGDERSSRHRDSRERRRHRSRERSGGDREHASSQAPGSSPRGSATASAAVEPRSSHGGVDASGSGVRHRGGDRESHRSGGHRSSHQRSSRRRSPRSETPRRPEQQASEANHQAVDPLEAVSASASNVIEKLQSAGNVAVE